MRRSLFVFLFLTIFAQGASAKLPHSLDINLRKAHKSRVEFGPYFGLFVGDTVSTSYIYGMSGAYNWSPHFAIVWDMAYSPLKVDRVTPFGGTVTSKRFRPVNAGLRWTTPAAIKLSHHNATEMDVYFFLGAGWLKVNQSDLVNGYTGFGTLIYLDSPGFAWKIEARSHIYDLPVAGGLSIDGVILTGPTFLFGRAGFTKPAEKNAAK